MANKVTWSPSTDVRVTSYRVEVAAAVSGPWSELAVVSDDISGNQNYDAATNRFFYVDNASPGNVYYRLTALDGAGGASVPSAPFQPIAPPAPAPAGAFELAISVADADTLLASGFSKIEIWCSVDRGGTYEELTAAAAAFPKLRARPANTEYQVGGRAFRFRLDGGEEHEIVFSEVLKTATPAQVAAIVNAEVPGVASVENNALVLTGPTLGRVGTVEVTSSAIPDLFAGPAFVRGFDARLSLSPGVFLYTFFDVAGSPEYRYKWRFSNNGADPISAFSERTLLPDQRLVGVPISIAVMRFVDVEGRPARGAVIISASGLVDGHTLHGGSKVYEADKDGLLQVQLVQGARIKVAIEGTSIVREIVVPTLASFDLMQVLSDAPDQFSVQAPPPLLTRRSL